jgi:hypothetical protein
MVADPHGPEIVVGQLQFELDGIRPLTLEEKLHQWLSSQEDDTTDVLTASLYVMENRFRRNRASRWHEVLDIQKPFRSDQSWLVSGGEEAIWLYDESWRDYIDGAYFFALICAHAACERELAGCLFPYREELDRSWLMWGLGKLIPAATEKGIIDDRTSEDLIRLNELRKVSAHFKVAHQTPTSVRQRALNIFGSGQDADYDSVFNKMIRSDALFSIRVATFVVLGNLGFGGPSSPEAWK